MGECCQCASVASFQCCQFPIVGCRGARRRAEAARVPLLRGAARWCARAGSPALFCGCGRLSTAAKMAAPHAFGWAPHQTDVTRPPRPCTAASSKGEGALATSRGEIGGRLGEATLPCGRDGARPSRCGRNKLRPSRWWSHSQVSPLPTSPTADQRAGGFSTRCPKRHRLSLRCWWLLAA